MTAKDTGPQNRPQSRPERPGRAEIAAEVRLIVRQGLKAALATIDAGSGHPYASLVTIATDPDGTPLLLLSKLALHTRNAAADARASLLVDASGADADPLSGGRVTLIGRLAPTESRTAPSRFLARHPSTEGYAQFSDFAFYALSVERAHFVGGFGRIVDLTPAELSVPAAGAVVDPRELERLNAILGPALAVYAAHHAPDAAKTGAWRMSGIDAEGVDLVGPGAALRIARRPATTPIAEELAALLRLPPRSA